MTYFVYLIECNNGSVYTGITTDVERRFKEHENGKGGRYTRSRGVKKLLYKEECVDRSSALRREAEIKSWKRDKKMELVATK